MKLARVNNFLLVLIVLVNGYVIVAPLWPQLSYKIHNHRAEQDKLLQQVHQAKRAGTKPSAAHPNGIVIPSMLLDQPVLDGPISQQYKILDRGIWRWPNGSTPDKGGNTVLIGHRFTYTNPRGVFYLLDKVRIGDEIAVWWNNHQYVYAVRSVHEVPPTDTAIENNSDRPQLTLFTCTPLWWPKDRLVVVATLENRS